MALNPLRLPAPLRRPRNRQRQMRLTKLALAGLAALTFGLAAPALAQEHAQPGHARHLTWTLSAPSESGHGA